MVEAKLLYGRLLVVCQVPQVAISAGPVLGVDLGVNTLIAATDGNKTILISGRGAKATVQWRAKRLAEIQSAQSKKTKRSRRHLRLQRRKYKMLDKARNRIKDLVHKATAKVAKSFPGSRLFVGEPFNDAARKMGRKQAQQVSSACNRKIISQLDYKTSGADVVPEPYSSQTCPVCGCRNKCRRLYKCQQCGFKAPRDVVGSSNIRTIGMVGGLRPDRNFKIPTITWCYPSKYPGHKPGSSGGSPASSSKAFAASRSPVL
jgi:transposase